jgi:hypothetical protein
MDKELINLCGQFIYLECSNYFFKQLSLISPFKVGGRVVRLDNDPRPTPTKMNQCTPSYTFYLINNSLDGDWAPKPRATDDMRDSTAKIGHSRATQVSDISERMPPRAID